MEATLSDPLQTPESHSDAPANPAKPEPVSTSLIESIRSERLTDALASAADIGTEAVSEAKIPGISTLVGIYRAQKQVRQNLELRNVIRFLQSLETTSAERRREFTDRLRREGKASEFGENNLLILSRVDDIKKPEMIGRLMAAHIDGNIPFGKAMRLVAIVNRCYVQDLAYLQAFKRGVQRSGTDIAASLFSAGLLADCGLDSGDYADPESGGTVYDLNEYRRLLREYAL
jgi:hypothetical protein